MHIGHFLNIFTGPTNFRPAMAQRNTCMTI